MSSQRTALSADPRDGALPKRNVAAGKRLAPLPPGLRARTRNVAETSTTPADSAASSFAHTAPQRSNSKARPAGSHNNGSEGKDGRRYLPPVSQEAQGGPSVATASSSPPSSSAAAAAASSALFALNSGRRSAPADATAHHTRYAHNGSRSRRNSGQSELMTGAGEASTVSAGSTRVAPRASTSEGARRSSLKAATLVSTSSAAHTRDDRKSDGASASPLLSSAGSSSARPVRQKPRPPVLMRPPPRVTASSPDKRADAPSAHAAGSNTTASSAMYATSSTAAIAAALRTPASTSTSTRTARSTNGAPSAVAAPPTSSNAVKTTADVPSTSAQENGGDAAQLLKATVHVTEPDLAYAPHDQDEAFYQDASQWAAQTDVPARVWDLLEGTALEPPHTTYLWTQAYPNPSELLPPPPTQSTSGFSVGGMKMHTNTSNNDGGTAAAAGDEELPLSYQHRDKEKRTGGFYACVRCQTPVCSPAFQVLPAAAALRGTAVFSRLNLKGVDLRVRTAGAPTAASAAAAAVQRPSFTPQQNLHRSGKGMSEAEAFLQGSGNVQFVAHCHHCGGCLGAMFIGDVILHPSSAASATTGTNTVPSQQPPVSHSSWQTSTSDKNVTTVTRELLCVNSACLQYTPYRTRAALNGELLGSAVDDPNPSLLSFATATEEQKGAAPGHSAGVTMRALFDAPRSGGWNLQGALRRTGEDGDSQAGSDDSSGGGSFDDLLEALNPYASGGRGGYDSDE